MKISYNWLKSYIPEIPTPEKLADIFTYHLCEVEGIEKKGEGEKVDTIFDINILPNRAHDLLSHQGIAHELASLLDIKYVDPTPNYKVPNSVPTKLQIKIEPEKCRRYMARIVRGVKIGPSIDWIKEHLSSIGQRSINNVVDSANLTMFDCGQPIHAFDLDKINGALVVRMAQDGEEIITLDNKNVKLNSSNLVIADEKNILAIAGVKGGKVAEVDENTKNIVIEVANFDPASIRKTGKNAHIFTDALKRFENELSPELCDFAMLEMSALITEIGSSEQGEEIKFEDIVDVYPKKQEIKTFSFSTDKISSILGLKVSDKEVETILKRYNFEYTKDNSDFKIIVPSMRLDLEIVEDMAEEVARILGYDKIKPKIPKQSSIPKVNEIYSKIQWAKNKLLTDGFSEVINYTFRDRGEVEVLESASDKKFLRTNLSDGLKESLKLNTLNAPLFGIKEAGEVKIFEIGTIFLKDGEEIHVAYNEKEKIIEQGLDDFFKPEENSLTLLQSKKPETEIFRLQNSPLASEKFTMWSLFPFITRDIAVWVLEDISSEDVRKVIMEDKNELIVKGPDLFDEFKKDGKISYAFKLIFQSYERTLTDTEINEIMIKIANKIKAKNTKGHDWQVR